MINIDKAFDALAKNSDSARNLATELLPFPPADLPSLKSIKGNGMDRAIVHGYTIAIEKTHKILDEKGNRKYPGEEGFLEAQQFRLMGEKNGYSAPAGWKIVNHEAKILYAIVEGNPILLENQAKKLGYKTATAVSANKIKLSELI